MPRTVMRDVGDRLRAALILGLVTVCALAVALVPDQPFGFQPREHDAHR